MMAMPMMLVCATNNLNGLAKPLHGLPWVRLHFGNPKSSPCLTRSTSSGGFLTLLGPFWPRLDTNGEFEPLAKAICHGWRIPLANTFRPEPSAFMDKILYRNGVLLAGP